MNVFKILLLCAVVACSAACSKRSSGPGMPRSEKRAMIAAKAPVNILDRRLESRMASELQSSEVGEDGLMRVAVTLRNRTYKHQHVQVRTVFKNAEGISTGDETAWRDLYLSPQQSQTYRSVARRTGAELSTVEVRLPRKPGR